MNLYHYARDNGASEPWNLCNEMVFSLDITWCSWMFGVECWDGAWTISFGPLKVQYWQDKI